MTNEQNSRSVFWPITYFGLLLLCALLGMVIYKLIFTQSPSSSGLDNKCIIYAQGHEPSRDDKKCLLNLYIVDTPAERERGLSGRFSLSADTGMLFIFNETGRQCMWMKDMHISIDILWLDINGKVIKLEEDVAPQTYPKEFCSDKTRFVIELPTGSAKRYRFKVGSVIAL